MELKKRESLVERNYAKNNEMSKSELKNSTPKKWLVASTMGIATLFYANPRSVFGSIGVIFGCAPAMPNYVINYSSTWHFWNDFSNNAKGIAFLVGIAAIVVTGIELLDFVIMRSKKDFNKNEYKKKNKKFFIFIIILWVAVVISFGTNLILDNLVLDMELPQFYENGKKEYQMAGAGLTNYLSIKNFDTKNVGDKQIKSLIGIISNYNSSIEYIYDKSQIIPVKEIDIVDESSNIIKKIDAVDDNGAFMTSFEFENIYNEFIKDKIHIADVEKIYNGEYVEKIIIKKVK